MVKFDWPVRLEMTGETHVGSWRDPSLPTLKAGPEKRKSLLPGHRYQTSFSWFRVQNKPCHCISSTGDDIRRLVRLDLPVRLATQSSSTGQFDYQIEFDWPIRLANGYRDPHLLSTAMIRYMVVVLARPIFEKKRQRQLQYRLKVP